MGATYDFDWSSEVFARFKEKHARASDFVRSLFYLPEDEIILWISENSPRWPRFKQGVKYVEKTWDYVTRHARENDYTPVKYYKRVINRRFLDKCDIPVDTDPIADENEEHPKETAARPGSSRVGSAADDEGNLWLPGFENYSTTQASSEPKHATRSNASSGGG